jgi:protein required for attachment to host cells
MKLTPPLLVVDGDGHELPKNTNKKETKEKPSSHSNNNNNNDKDHSRKTDDNSSSKSNTIDATSHASKLTKPSIIGFITFLTCLCYLQ